MESIGRVGKNERLTQATREWFFPLKILTFLPLIVLIGSVSLYAGKPSKIPKLDSNLCSVLGGIWTVDTCTIGGGAWGQATSSFLIPNVVSLVIQGSGGPAETGQLPCTFVINFGVTVENKGVISVETDGDWGFCNLGTLMNSGTVNVANSAPDPTPTLATSNVGIVNVATIANSGTITVSNIGGSYSRGIWNFPHIPDGETPWNFDTILPTITNSGTITIENNGDRSTGISNEGAFSNTGTISVSAAIQGNYGFANSGTFTNEASGLLENFYGNPDLVPITTEAPTYGVGNFDGTMINYGTVTNGGVIGTNGWAMLTYGTLENHGILYQTGGVLVNYGTVENFGTIMSSAPDYPHNDGICNNHEEGEGC